MKAILRRFSILSVIKAINAAGFVVYNEAKTSNGDTVLHIDKNTNAPLIDLENTLEQFNNVDCFKWALLGKGHSQYAPELTRLYVIIRKEQNQA